jgi:23S rRNA-/tRNA-specific pseudouridylate synthase/SAM-dependent methyltransferase
VVFEDADLVVVNKPPGLITANMPGEDRESLFDHVKAHIRQAKRKAGRVWIIHRLDKEASGLLVFAKTEKAFQWLKEDLRARRMHRLYLAVVEGEIGGESEAAKQRDSETGREPESKSPPRPRIKQAPSGTIQSFIRDDDFGNVTSVRIGEVARETARSRGSGGGPPRGARPPEAARFKGTQDEGGPRLAVTHWRLIAAGKGRSLLQLRLETGRKNQIRVHLQEFRHPIIGDARYGATTDPIHRLALHATELGFTHPTTGQTVRYRSPAPASFYRAVDAAPPADTDETATAPAPSHPPSAPPPPPSPAPTDRPAADTAWDHVADWYDDLIEEERSDHFRHVIQPGTMRLLRPPAGGGMRVLDIACGQGSLSRAMAAQGIEVVGVDASPRLIDAARRRATGAARFEVGDARALEQLDPALVGDGFDAVACVMALMNIDPLEPVLRGAATLLKPGGALVAVILHPAFRAPGQTSWAWDQEPGPRPRFEARGRPGGRGGPSPRRERQYRRVDGYLSPGQMPITMNPGRAAHGAEPVTTWTFHRPIQTYVKALVDAGFVVEALEEWPSLRTSQPGPRAAEENRARREIPMFLGIRAVRKADEVMK